MRAPRAVIWLLLLVACAPAAARSQAAAPNGATDAEYEVYSDVLENVYPGSARSVYLVTDSTEGTILFGVDELDIILQGMRSMPGVTPELVRAYEAANAHPATLEEGRFDTRIPVRVIGEEEQRRLRDASGKGGPTGMPDSIPARDYLIFSRVGFSSDGNHAVLHVRSWCGGLCGEGRILLLERNDGEWVLQTSRRTIIA